uniref:Arginine/serine-rich protein PNISR n=1 Tax=Phallusia mammillata TaxID=59560 RepID=A0A6F9DPR9_9ASCI|nr:arginine/serine-rich protein PNISR [Phallusia mammillata]
MWNQIPPPGSVPDGVQANENGNVDWGALAQAWIQSKSEQEKNQISGQSSAQNNDKGWKESSVFHSSYYGKNWNIGVQRQWFPNPTQQYHHPGNVGIAPLPPPPPVPPPVPEAVWEPNTNTTENMPSTTEHQNQIQISKTFNKWVPNETSCYQHGPASAAEEISQKKVLPAWIREGLEKIGKTNPVKQRNRKQEDKTTIIFEDVERKMETTDDESDAELPQENGCVPEYSEVTETEKTEIIETQEDIVLRIRKWLTTILLEVTDAEISNIAVNTFKQCSKAPAKPLIQSSALSSICDTGLVAGYSSDEESVLSDEDQDIDQQSLLKKIDEFQVVQHKRLESLGLAETDDLSKKNCSSDHKDGFPDARQNVKDKKNDMTLDEDYHLAASRLAEVKQSKHFPDTERYQQKSSANHDSTERSPSKTRTHKKRKHSKKSHHLSSKDRKSPHKKSRKQ